MSSRTEVRFGLFDLKHACLRLADIWEVVESTIRWEVVAREAAKGVKA